MGVNLALQIGHVGHEEGAAHETTVLRKVFPEIVAALNARRISPKLYDGRLVSHPGDYSLKHDLFLSIHCDSGGVKSSGYSTGWSTYPQHRGSEDWIRRIGVVYGSKTGLRRFGENHTSGLRSYYGYRRMRAGCKCGLLELGFVSNPLERKWLMDNAKLVGEAVAEGIVRYLQDKNLVKKEGEPVLGIVHGEVKQNVSFVTTGVVDVSAGQEVYIDLVNFGSEPASVTILLQRENGDYGSIRPIVPASAPGIFGLVSLKLSDAFNNKKIGKFILKIESNQKVNIKVTQVL